VTATNGTYCEVTQFVELIKKQGDRSNLQILIIFKLMIPLNDQFTNKISFAI
jgi:hypothetical protein